MCIAMVHIPGSKAILVEQSHKMDVCGHWGFELETYKLILPSGGLPRLSWLLEQDGFRSAEKLEGDELVSRADLCPHGISVVLPQLVRHNILSRYSFSLDLPWNPADR